MKRRVWISFPNGPKLTTRWGHMPMLMGGLAGMIEHLKLRNWVDAVCTSNSLQTSIPVHVSLSLSCDRCMYISRVADCLKFPMSGMWYILYGYWWLKIRNKHAMYSHISIKTYQNHQGPTKKHRQVSPGQFLSSKKSGQLWKSQYMIFVQRCCGNTHQEI